MAADEQQRNPRDKHPHRDRALVPQDVSDTRRDLTAVDRVGEELHANAGEDHEGDLEHRFTSYKAVIRSQDNPQLAATSLSVGTFLEGNSVNVGAGVRATGGRGTGQQVVLNLWGWGLGAVGGKLVWG